MILVNGKTKNRITVADRGLQYGDGLFETIAFRQGTAEFIDAHLDRLISACRQLNIQFQQVDQLRNELESIYEQLTDDNCIIKIIITRGSGGRGYFSDNSVEPTRIISTHDYPSYPESYSQSGITVRICQHKLSENTCLAGLKHLNRLDNVIGRSEWNDINIAEGLMFDQSEHLIEGTMSNVFIVKSGQLISPLLNKSGVEGVMKAQIINLAQRLGLTVKQSLLSLDDLKKADEIFICNSIIGIWPVIAISDTADYSLGSITQQLQQSLAKVTR